MKLKIEFRFAVLASLLTLLWLTTEFVSGIQDKFIVIQPYVSLLGVVILIPLICFRLALKEKIEEFGRLTFRQAFLTGFIITIFTCILMVPTQLAFHRLINPDFFETMIQYTAKNSKISVEAAALFFNLKSYLIQAVLYNLVAGTIIALILAWRMRTVR
jgi:hypothetical protein